MRHPLFPYDVLPEPISGEMEKYLSMALPKPKSSMMTAPELQARLLNAKTKSDAIDAFAAWASQTGAFSDIDRKLWDKLQAWRSPRKASER